MEFNMDEENTHSDVCVSQGDHHFLMIYFLLFYMHWCFDGTYFCGRVW